MRESCVSSFKFIVHPTSVESMAEKLKGLVALLTGASGEIGSATAIEFAKEGAIGLALQYNRSRRQADAVIQSARKLGADGAAFRADLTDPIQAKGLVNKTLARFGRLDALICLAGHPFRRNEWFEKFEQLTPEQLNAPLQVDLLGNAYVIQASVPVMRRQRRGKIVLVGSTPALTGDSVGVSYLMAKAGILALTRALAQQLGPDNIYVNALALGAIDTKSTIGHLAAREKDRLAAEASLGRLGTPHEVARKIVFLSSRDSDFVTGQTIVVDGGFAMR